MKLTRLALGILLPPVGVFLTYGLSTTLFINVLLTLLGWIPGSIHAVWAIAKHEERLSQQDTI
jgi:uncharacterized membrane protein YqaE (UPF0057 family)